MQQTGVVRMLLRSVLLAYHDILVLLGIGLFGSLLSDDPRIERIRPWLALAFAGVCVLALVFWALPAKVWSRLRGRRIA